MGNAEIFSYKIVPQISGRYDILSFYEAHSSDLFTLLEKLRPQIYLLLN